MSISTEVIVGMKRSGKTYITQQNLAAAKGPEKNLLIDTFNEYSDWPAITPDAIADFVKSDAWNARIAIPYNLTQQKKQAYLESAIDSASRDFVSGNLIVEDMGNIYGTKPKNFTRYIFDFFRWKAANSNTLNVVLTFSSFDNVPLWILGRSLKFRIHRQLNSSMAECFMQLSYADIEANPLQKKSPILKNAQLYNVATEIIDKAVGQYDYLIMYLDKPKIDFYTDKNPFLVSDVTQNKLLENGAFLKVYPNN